MPSYAIRVRSDQPVRASLAMHNAEMPTMGPAGDGFVRTSSGGWTVGEEFIVFVIARDVPDALDRVKGVGADIELLGDPMPQTPGHADDV
jgi:hypothetical protein